MDKNGNLFFSLLENDAIGCWNIRNHYTIDNIRIVAQNHKTMQAIAGMKVIKNRNGREELWILSTRIQVILNIEFCIFFSITMLNFYLYRNCLLVHCDQMKPIFVFKQC
jgi:hypothetical protein